MIRKAEPKDISRIAEILVFTFWSFLYAVFIAEAFKKPKDNQNQ